MDIDDICTGKAAAEQGRAPALYDEQLQRQQQEKLLFRQLTKPAAPAPLPIGAAA
jgi:hypothetical protein